MATTTDVTRGTLGVAGGPFGLLLPRSQDFQELANAYIHIYITLVSHFIYYNRFEDILRLKYPDPVHLSILLFFFNLQWSRYVMSCRMNVLRT